MTAKITRFNGVHAIVLLAASVFVAPTAVAYERDATAAESRHVIAKLRGLGYRSITDVDVVGRRFVVDAKSPAGRDVDVILDKGSLRILRVNPS
ncbi:MAG: PepSY domain-containing protein [Hyphomicrobiaceae bacterium]